MDTNINHEAYTLASTELRKAKAREKKATGECKRVLENIATKIADLETTEAELNKQLLALGMDATQPERDQLKRKIRNIGKDIARLIKQREGTLKKQSLIGKDSAAWEEQLRTLEAQTKQSTQAHVATATA